MGKIFIEDQEVMIKERDIVGDEQHIIDNSKYISRAVVRKEFESSIFSYNETESVLISQLYLFGESYYKIVFFHDALQKAWKLVEVSSELEVHIKRLDKDYFFITADGKASEEIASQISFCRLKPSTKVEEITISFTRLNEVRYIKSKGTEYILVSYSDKRNGRLYHTLAIYNQKGKCEKTFYEYCKEDGIAYRYEVINNEKINIIKMDPSIPPAPKAPPMAPFVTNPMNSPPSQRAPLNANQPNIQTSRMIPPPVNTPNIAAQNISQPVNTQNFQPAQRVQPSMNQTNQAGASLPQRNQVSPTSVPLGNAVYPTVQAPPKTQNMKAPPRPPDLPSAK